MRFPPVTYTAGWIEKLIKDVGFSSVQVSDFPGYCATENLRSWCEYLWGFMGTAAGGWTQKDEDSWDQAVDEMVRSLKANPGVQAKEDGSAVVKMVAHVVIATK
jgi:hypothetical protein